MSNPIWTTPAGHLGTIQENEYYSLPVIATAGSSDIVYILIAGSMPPGLLIRRDGVIEGQPTTKVDVAGIPQEVGQDVTSTFAVRATADSIVTDRTFSLTVTGQDAPMFITAGGSLGTFKDGTNIDIQLTAHDPDPDDTYTFTLSSGELPPGIAMSSSGRLDGAIIPSKIPGTPDDGYDQTYYDQYGYDFTDTFISKAYEFTVSLTDGKDVSLRTFSIDVRATNNLRSSFDGITADSETFGADSDTRHPPIILNSETIFNNVLHNNNWFVHIIGHDFDLTGITYSISAGALPSGITINSSTGWISGSLPQITDIKKEYNFTVRASKNDDAAFYTDKVFQLNVVVDSNITPTWSSPAMLGSLISGEASRLQVKATSTQLENFYYKVKAGTKSGLPQGLTLQTDGTITGVPGFGTFSNDNHTTSYDKKLTTFDKASKVTIQAINASGDIRAEREFTITIKNENFKPYENVYLVNQSSQAERDIWKNVLSNTNNIPLDLIYRRSDPQFGLQYDARMLLVQGLQPKLSSEYMHVLQKNFYKLELNYSEIKTAQAVDSDTDKVVYEVVYVEIVDRITETNTLGKVVPGNVAITANSSTTITNYSSPLTVDEITKSNTNLITGDVKNKTKLYPSGLEIMRKVLVDGIGYQDSRVLPLWMRSTQADGKVLGYVSGVVLCYAKPTKANHIKYYLDAANTTKEIQKTSFTVDRLLWDNSRSKNFNKSTQKWTTAAETTFDSDTTTFEGAYTSFFGNVDNVETNWNTGDTYLKFPRETIMDTPN